MCSVFFGGTRRAQTGVARGLLDESAYGREISQWVQKAYTSSLRGATVVCLIPCRTDTAWFHDLILGQAEIRFLSGRLT